MGARQRSWGIAAVAALVLPGFGATTAPPPARPEPAAAAVATACRSFPITGTAGCSARGCHGRIDPGPDHGVRLNEFSLWLASDKHAQAYRALQGDLAGAIARKVFAEGRTPWTEPACLACHTNPQAAVGDSALLQEERRSGVGCEACHGGAERWLPSHTSKEWKDLGPETKCDYGMNPVGDPAALAETCVGCHIGAPADPAVGLPLRDMNHDMIAAGHPRLTFEFGAFRANLPPHWNEAAKKRDDDFEAKAWAVGQVVSARAALNLLADRATAVSRPWPEFAEYDCSACHHDLKDPSWRRERGYAGRPAGSLPWGMWYSTMPRWLDPSLADGFDDVARAMESPLKDQEKLSSKAREFAERLKPLRDKEARTRLGPEEIRKMRAALKNQPAPDWDAAEQLYLAAAALSQVEGPERSQKELNEVVRLLALPPGSQGPKDYRPETFLKQFHDSLDRLRP